LEENEMNDFEPHRIMALFLARFERTLLLAIGFLMALLLASLFFKAACGSANAAGFNSWPHPKGIAHCWTSLFEQYGVNMLKVTQNVATGSASVKYRIALQGGEEKELVCHPASGKVTEAEH
jgi:hypothetical protein